ncbi:MAG: DUF2971 domain-containing protein [Phycisphaerae bacterium]|nr:DUF2971 domain-containing protein [Phycisphaerae bacterium]
MGTFHTSCRIENHRDRSKAVHVEDLLADTNCEHTWIPGAVLEEIGVTVEKECLQLRTASGQSVIRSVGFAILRIGDSFTIDEVVFAKPGDGPVLGTRTLDGLDLSLLPDLMKTPPCLYKYYAFNEWTENIFERNEIYFQSPDGFNDPFDSKPLATYEGTNEQRLDRLVQAWRNGPAKDKKVEDLRIQALDLMQDCRDVTLMLPSVKRSAERIRKQLGIFCMTSRKDSILMWAHYAEAHTGFCLGFETGNPFFGRAQPVSYRRDRPCRNLIEPLDPEKGADDLFVKSEDWAYEDEWRIDDHIKGPGVHQYPAEALREVILGCRIKAGDRHRIMQWCRARNPQPTVYWAEEMDSGFGLDIKQIPWITSTSR